MAKNNITSITVRNIKTITVKYNLLLKKIHLVLVSDFPVNPHKYFYSMIRSISISSFKNAKTFIINFSKLCIVQSHQQIFAEKLCHY